MSTTVEQIPAPPQTRHGAPRERWAVAGGFTFVAFGLVTSFLPGAPPAANASAAKVASYFRDHAGGIKAQQVLGTLGTVTILWWFGALWRAMSRSAASEGRTPLLAVTAAASLAIGVALAAASGAMTSAAAIRIDSIGDNAQVLWTLSVVTVATAGFAIASFITAVCVFNHRARFVPAWTNVVGGLAALAFLVGGLGAGTDAGAIVAFGYVAFMVWCVWIVAVSCYLWREA